MGYLADSVVLLVVAEIGRARLVRETAARDTVMAAAHLPTPPEETTARAAAKPVFAEKIVVETMEAEGIAADNRSVVGLA